MSRTAENIDESQARLAKNMYLKACATRGTSQSWLGTGRACFALKEYHEAEDAFSVCDTAVYTKEANILNNRDSEVWAHLSLLSLTMGRTIEANQAIAQALRLGIKDSEILK
jgi:cytochrome c-type biogenesis protein CcmH/NrfG